MNVKEIGNRIKYARELRNYTLDYIASEIGVAKSTIQRYENGLITNPKLPVLQSIANVLKVNPAWLSGQNVPMTCPDSVSEIINQRLKELDITLEQVAEKAEVPLYWLQNIDTFVPGYMEFLIEDNRELDWNDEIGGYKSYEWITRVAKALNISPAILRSALAKQEDIHSDKVPSKIKEIYEIDSKNIAAHKDGDNFTPEELQKIKEYKELLIAARPKKE